METIDTGKKTETDAKGLAPEDQTAEQRTMCEQTEYDETAYCVAEVAPLIRKLQEKCQAKGLPHIITVTCAQDKEKHLSTTAVFIPGERAPGEYHRAVGALNLEDNDPIGDLLSSLLGK